MVIVCIGPKGSGKTHLLTCIRDPETINVTSHSVSTIGTNIFTVKNPNLKNPSTERSKKQKPMCEVREIGEIFSYITHYLWLTKTNNIHY